MTDLLEGSASTNPATTPSRRERAFVPVLFFLGMVVAVLSSLGAPLIPTIATDYQVSVADAQWSLTIALLVGAVTAPILGRLGDGPHRRTVVLGTLGLVVVGSVLSAVPLPYAWLLAGRGLQGVGLGLMPLAMTVARDHLPAERARSTVAVLSITAAAGVGLGYPLTGLLADHFGFHAPFWFGAVVGLLALALAIWVMPSSRHLTRRPLDGLGAILLGLGLFALLLCLSEGERWGWASPRLLLVALGGVLILGIWVRQELSTEYPLVNLRLMKHRAVLTANATGLFAALGMYMLLPMMTRFVQAPPSTGYGFGSSVVVAGLVLLPFSVTTVLAGRLVPLLARRLGRTLVLPVGCLLLAASMVLFLLDRSQLWEVFLVSGIAGLGMGVTFSAIPGLIVRAVPPEETGSALGINPVIRQIGFSIGSALGAAILVQHTYAPDPLPTDPGYSVSSWAGIGLCVFAAVLGFLLTRRETAAAARTPGVPTLSPAAERELAEENVDGMAGGIMLLDAESAAAELADDRLRSRPRRPRPDANRMRAAG